MAELNFFLDPQKRTFITNYASLLPNASPERIQSELLRIVSVLEADEVILLLKEVGILEFWANNSKVLGRQIPMVKDVKFLNNRYTTIKIFVLPTVDRVPIFLM